MRRSFAFKFTLLILVWLLVGIACEQVPTSTFWPAMFGALTLPVAFGLTLLLVLYWLRRNWRVSLLPLLALGLTWPHFQRGLALHPLHRAVLLDSWGGVNPDSESHTAQDAPIATNPQALRLLSANVRIFNVYAHLQDPDQASSKNAIRWLAESPADVLCLQEYYNEPKAIKGNSTVFHATQRIGAGSGRQSFVSPSFVNLYGYEFGMAVFSRFPMVRRGSIFFGKHSYNHAVWVDLARPAPANDTIRVFNVHLQSMSMEEKDIVAATSSKAGFRQKAKGLLRRFRNGAVARATQIDTVVAHIRRSPYPVLLAGDLNDLPYSYAYDQLADHLQNAWTTVGTGIGSTYNGRLPALRIDNQFASPDWQVLDCRVYREIPWSDHFPQEGLYQLKTKVQR